MFLRIFAFALSLVFASVAMGATLTVAPVAGLRDEALTEFRITGLAPNQRVTLRARSNDLVGGPWTSEAQFAADSDGAVDVAKQHPVSGSYRHADVMGLLWSLRTADEFTLTYMLIGAFSMGTFHVELSVLDESGAVLAQTAIPRHSARPEMPVTRQLWSPLGYEMALFYPANQQARQTVVHITGSGGGRLEGFCEMLAAHGYFAACVPYFGVPGTPATLNEVPLELFRDAIDAVLSHPMATGTEVIFSGVSRGGEGALLVGATFPERVKAVLSFAPAAHLWDGETDFVAPPRAAWTLGGVPLPYLTIDREHLFEFNTTFPWIVTPTFRYSEATATPEQRAAARIPVENIDGPVFLSSGLNDALSPSDEWANTVAATLRTAGHPHEVMNVKGPQAGHLAFNVAYTPIPQTVAAIYECGGTPEGNAEAAAAQWREVLRFLGGL